MMGPSRLGVVLGAAWLFVGCHRDPCGKYEQTGFVYQRCLVVQAELAPSIEEARCAEAGPDEEECRIVWVEAHLDHTLEQLLAACNSEECHFVALDFLPSPLPRQLELCNELVRLSESCAVHSFVRYFAANPSVAKQEADLVGIGTWARTAALEAGLASQCGRAVDCAVYGPNADACQLSASRHSVVDCAVYRPGFPRPP